MATWQYELADPPTESRALELWLQHAAGFILFEDVRRHALECIDPSLGENAKAAARKGIDDAVYGLMQVIDGVTGVLSNGDHAVSIDFMIRLATRRDSEGDRVIAEVDPREGDGMCMGYHGWLEGDFGASPIAVPESSDEPDA